VSTLKILQYNHKNNPDRKRIVMVGSWRWMTRIVVPIMLLFLKNIISGFRPLVRSRQRSGSSPSRNNPFRLLEAGRNSGESDFASSSSSNFHLLGAAIRRASSTLSGKDSDTMMDEEKESFDDTKAAVRELVNKIADRAQGVVMDQQSPATRSQSSPLSSFQLDPTKTYIAPSGPVERYSGSPAIANTALAHTLWASVLRPYQDSAIDATCGNGHDSLHLARILFPPLRDTKDPFTSELLCVDIQQMACENTTMTLSNELPTEVMEQHVKVLHCSHTPLPKPTSTSSVGLVVYNLGWLPNSNKNCITDVESTIASLVDAFLMVRIKGMVSVMTYPKTNPDEDAAARALLECMALLSSRIQSWHDYLEDSCNLSDPIKLLVSTAMERVVELGDRRQTWRVSEHKKLGMDRAPVLFTATRIK
jgi:hypothetical protein